MILNADRKDSVSAAAAVENIAARTAAHNRPIIVRSTCGKTNRKKENPCEDTEVRVWDPAEAQAWAPGRTVSDRRNKMKIPTANKAKTRSGKICCPAFFFTFPSIQIILPFVWTANAEY